ncbi:S41 family peptidase [Robiginitalea sp. M366]|uniref:S41 family peptidase n=1 Tax=Robiginitalea aestuariiviva TaxID=3036903 RepID=UPI00240E660F|nr:S41 family peptidase [Robiginitalea aestuariiviva]MDG1571340.1 S41 family peptidase [Robiginitalea aestuariiviva]
MKSDLKKSYYIGPAVVALALALGIFIGGKLHFNDTPERLFTTNSKKDKLNRLIDYIDYEYVDEVDTDSIVDVTVNNILDKLDPHSVYIPKSEMKRVSENMKGDFVGIGINFYKFRDTITVTRTIEDGPSDRAGLLPGDKILMADADTLYGKRLPDQEIVSRLKGKEGSSVRLTVYRKTEDRTLQVNLKRDHVPIRSIDAAFMLTPDMGYIRMNRFAESTYEEFSHALKELQAEGAEKLTLDLRDNPGGYLNIAERIADAFLPKGKLILFTRNKKGQVDSTYATARGRFENRPVYVLINERSASASEIIAGALQDNDIGTIVGRRSFGKGLVQREMDLGDGSAVRLTVSRYYTPTGRSIQRNYGKGSEDYYDQYLRRYHNGELTSRDSIPVADSLKFTTPGGKTVYGGGGIIPDVFVPIDGNEEEAIAALDSRGYFSSFVFEYLEEDRSRFADFDEERFYAEYQPDDILFDRLVEFLTPFKLSINYYDYEGLLKAHIKAGIAEQLFSPDLKAKVLVPYDSVLREVMELDRPTLNPEVPRD